MLKDSLIEVWQAYQSQAIAAITTGFVAYLDANQSIWIPNNIWAKTKISFLVYFWSLTNAGLTFLFYPIIYPYIHDSLELPLWLCSVIAGSGYLLIIKIISLKFQVGKSEPQEFSLNNLIYQRIQKWIFVKINKIVEPYLIIEIEAKCQNKTLKGLSEEIIQKIEFANSKALSRLEKNKAKESIAEIVNDDTYSVELKMKILACKLITENFNEED